MNSEEHNSAANLNEHQARCLSVTCQYIDKIIGEMEHVLNLAASKAAFPKYVGDISSSQRRTIEDYFARIRAQLARILDGQGIPRPEPTIPASRAVSTGLLSIDIAVEELRPPVMRGYGQLSPEVATELEGICGELRELIGRVSQYLLQDAGQDLRQRLTRLEQTSAELELLAKVEQVVTARGLVEFRNTIAGITDRLEDQSLEIAVFGRVSSGKSSLLNAILGQDILPVGVTPITVVPTRIRYHQVPLLTIWYAGRLPETVDLARLAEFASEHGNPGNQKRVTRMIVHIPSERLREGVTLVDTPGLGSLATTGAAETLAYLPNCDLGVVLIDAGSTITQGDLETIQALYQAGIPVQVLLSKADLLSPQDRQQMISYVKQSIANEYRLKLQVFPVSAIAAQRVMLEKWFQGEILPIYERFRGLKSTSIRRKVGALRDAVVAALTVQIRRTGRVTAGETERFRDVEAKLRKMTGRISEARGRLEREIRALEGASELLLERSAICLAEKWAGGESDDLVVFESIVSDVREQSKVYREQIEKLAQAAHQELEDAAKTLGFPDGPSRDEFTSIIRGMPAFDFAEAKIVPGSGPSWMRAFGNRGLRASARRSVRARLNQPLTHALFLYSGVLREWATTVVKVIETRFASFAVAYRAQMERALKGATLGGSERDALLYDVRELGGAAVETSISVGSTE